MAETNDSLVTVPINSSLNKDIDETINQDEDVKQEKGIFHNMNN